jgi:c-di-GMP-related signal transduction protein
VTAPSAALSPGEGKPAPKPGTQFVARQPILGADEKVFGYELLFRNGVEDFFNCSDLDEASRSTLNTSMLLGLDVLCDGQRAFINCTRDILL